MARPATRSPSGRARRDEVRVRLLDLVEDRLRDGASFVDLSVADLAAEVGISRSTFYAYFIDKANLLRLWYAQSMDAVSDAARAWWRLDGSATPADVRAVLKGIVDACRAHPQLLAATHEAVGYDHEVRAAVESAMRRYIQDLAAHIREGQRDGFVDPSLPPAETAFWLQWMFERGLQQLMRTPPEHGLTGLLDAYAAIVWNTLYEGARRGRAG